MRERRKMEEKVCIVFSCIVCKSLFIQPLALLRQIHCYFISMFAWIRSSWLKFIVAVQMNPFRRTTFTHTHTHPCARTVGRAMSERLRSPIISSHLTQSKAVSSGTSQANNQSLTFFSRFSLYSDFYCCWLMLLGCGRACSCAVLFICFRLSSFNSIFSLFCDRIRGEEWVERSERSEDWRIRILDTQDRWKQWRRQHR